MKHLTYLFAIVLLLVLLTACASAETPSASAGDAAETSTEIEAEPVVQNTADETKDASVFAIDQFPGFPAFASSQPMLDVIEDRGETVVISHRFGETEIPKEPQRVFADAAMLPTALLLDLNVVAAYHYPELPLLPDWETQSAGIELVEAPDYNTNFEWVLSHEPDLILVYSNIIWASDDPQDIYELLSEIAPTVVLGDDPVTYWEEAAVALADVLEVDDAATTALNNSALAIAEACEPLKASVGDDTTLRLSIWNEQIWVIGPGYEEDERYIPYVDAIHHVFCGLMPPENLYELVGTDGAIQLSEEFIPELQADHLFISVSGNTGEVTYQDLLDNPLWQTVPAIQNGQVYVTPYLSGTSYDVTLYAINLYMERMTTEQQ